MTGNHPSGAPAVANMSLGGGASTTVDNAVKNAIADGVTFAVAAGNSNADACRFSPARVPEALTVGATTQTDAKASYSNYGKCLDLWAPGTSITSSWNSSDSATNTISGTSMATPHVAGVAALYLQGNPSSNPATVVQRTRCRGNLECRQGARQEVRGLPEPAALHQLLTRDENATSRLL